MNMIYQLPSALLPVFTLALETIPADTPSRWDKIAKYMSGYQAAHPNVVKSSKLQLGTNGKTVEVNISNKNGLKLLHDHILGSPDCVWMHDLSTLDDSFHAVTGVHPLIFLPSEQTCTACGSNRLITDNRPSIVTVYTHKGELKASSYHKKCPSPLCGRKFYMSYTLDMNGEKIYKPESTEKRYFIPTSQIGFGREYLASTADMVEAAALSFTAACECYEVTHNTTIERQRLEEAYFLYRLLDSKGQSLCVKQRNDSARIDIEALCKKNLETNNYKKHFQDHKCDTPGCREGFLMADGIEKVHRRTCAAPNTAIKSAKGMPRIVNTCPETLDFATKSKFCKEHHYLEKQPDSQPQQKYPRIVMTINVEHMKVSSTILSMVDDLPDNNDKTVHIGCKTARNVDRFSERSAGIMALVKPCGVIVDYVEMLSCESPSQLFVQLLRLEYDSPLEIKYLGYDRGCEFEPFLKNLAKKGNVGARMLLDRMEFLVDRFHIGGHTTPMCNIQDPQCRYHPDLPRFETVKDVNTECAEQCFAWLGKFKSSLKYMSHYKFNFILHRIIQSRNRRIVKKLKMRGKMSD